MEPADDDFLRRGLPPPEQWPDYRYELPELRYPTRLNVATELLDGALAHGWGARRCVVGESESWTYAQLAEAAARAASVLRERGIGTGTRLLLRMDNSPLLAATWLATLRLGAIAVTSLPQLRARELAVMLRKAEIRHAVCDDALAGELINTGPPLDILLAGDLHTAMATAPPITGTADTAADDFALIAFTSGSTGEPKACLHRHRDLLAIADTFSRHVLRPQAGDLFCGTPSLGFTFGLGCLLIFPLRAGAASLLADTATPEKLAAAIARWRPTICATAPTAYARLAGLAATHDLTSLRRALSAGEYLPEATRQRFAAATGLALIDGIGSTEMLHIFIAAADGDIRPGAIGRVVPGFAARIVDAAGQELPAGEAGYLAVRGPTGCRYLNDARQRDYVRNGWNVTGDICRRDGEGYFSYLARSDDLIVSAGHKIAAPEVEACLLEHRAVLECAVVARPDAARGSIVKAFIVTAPGIVADRLLAAELQTHVKARLAPFKYPREIDFVECLPRNAAGKLQRFKLREAGGTRKPDPAGLT